MKHNHLILQYLCSGLILAHCIVHTKLPHEGVNIQYLAATDQRIEKIFSGWCVTTDEDSFWHVQTTVNYH